jgi:hypothetical protein
MRIRTTIAPRLGACVLAPVGIILVTGIGIVESVPVAFIGMQTAIAVHVLVAADENDEEQPRP